MDYSTLLYKRNRQIVCLFTFGTITHYLLSPIIPLAYKVSTPYFGMLFCALLVLFIFKRINESTLMLLNTFGINLYIFHVNFEAPAFIHLIFFILPFFVGIMYQSLKVNITLFVITLTEVLLLFSLFPDTYFSPLTVNDHHALLILICFVSMIAILQSINMQNMWDNIKSYQVKMEHNLKKNEGSLQEFISNEHQQKHENEKLLMEKEQYKVAGEIAAGVAHEIRNPMSVIAGFIQMMNEDSNNPYKEYTKIIEPELQRVDLIISEFLSLAKPNSTYMNETNIHALLNDVITLFRPEFKLRKIIFKVNWNATHTYIFCEENMMKQLFINLIKNAMEAVDENGVITLLVENDEEHVVFNIIDNGVGIKKNSIDRIFEPFYTTKQNGTGLGMLISRKIVTDHAGTMTVESIERMGTNVTIRLPISKEN